MHIAHSFYINNSPIFSFTFTCKWRTVNNIILYTLWCLSFVVVSNHFSSFHDDLESHKKKNYRCILREYANVPLISATSIIKNVSWLERRISNFKVIRLFSLLLIPGFFPNSFRLPEFQNQLKFLFGSFSAMSVAPSNEL